MNGLSLIRHLNDEAAREANEANEANEAMLVGDMFREINEEIAADEAQEANEAMLRDPNGKPNIHTDAWEHMHGTRPNEDPGTIRERLAVIQENTDPVVIELILTMASECTELGLAALLINVIEVGSDPVLADDMMRQIVDTDSASAVHILAHMQALIDG